MSKIGVIGAGAWGTALAMAAQRAGNDVIIQAHEPDVAKAINDTHENPTFLKNFKLDERIKATGKSICGYKRGCRAFSYASTIPSSSL